jgi:hypothetical protein
VRGKISLLPPAARSDCRAGETPLPRLPVILFAALALALGGCFESSDALITAANADHPWTALRAAEFSWHDGAWKSEGNVTLRRDGSDYVLRDEESRDVTHFLLHQIGDNTYVAQSRGGSGSGNESYMFALVVVDGKRVYQYSFDDLSKRCKIPGIDPAVLKLKAYEDGCSVPSLAALTQIFETLQKSQPKFEAMYVIEP